MSTTATTTSEPLAIMRDADNHLNITLHQVKLAAAGLPDDSARLLTWLFQAAKSEGWNRNQIAAHLDVSTTTVYRVLTGKYEGDVQGIIDRIARFKRLHDDRRAANAPAFIQTSLTKRIFQACDFSLISQSVVFIWGENQIGKTHALEEYQRTHNHGQTIYVRMPAASGVLMVAQEIAKAIGLSPKGCYTKLRQYILRSIDDKNTLILDEMHQCFITYQKGNSIKVLEFIREIHDRTKCGLVLVGTNVWRDEVNGGEQKKVLAQLRNRGVAHIQLEDKPLPADLKKFYSHYSLPEPTDRAAQVVADVIHTHGLGKFTKLLMAASRRANKLSEPLSWDGVLATHDTLAALSAKSRL
jgi:DNA transposition AAA+ family ATPase